LSEVIQEYIQYILTEEQVTVRSAEFIEEFRRKGYLEFPPERFGCVSLTPLIYVEKDNRTSCQAMPIRSSQNPRV
jgi:hypothetical protein